MPIDGFLELLQDDGATIAIPGESLDAAFKKRGSKPMEFTNFTLESQRDLSTDKGEDDGESLFTFSITKEIDAATPLLFTAFCKFASKLPTTLNIARVTLRKAAGQGGPLEYLVYEFGGIAIKTWKLDCKDGDDLPEEELEFTFNDVLITYKSQKTSGAAAPSKSQGWDFTEHKER